VVAFLEFHSSSIVFQSFLNIIILYHSLLYCSPVHSYYIACLVLAQGSLKYSKSSNGKSLEHLSLSLMLSYRLVITCVFDNRIVATLADFSRVVD
jgi:hypothetical protein